MSRPRIGIIFHKKVHDNYGYAVYQSGGFPLYLGTETNPKESISAFDGLLLAGGGDVLSVFFNEVMNKESGLPDMARDFFEIDMVREAVKQAMPILGICRGMQVINIALGGTVFQDIGEDHRQKANPMAVSHSVRLSPHSLLKQVLKKDVLAVNSFHHQSVKELAKGLKPVAYSSDGILEAFEGHNIWGLQWHPEWLFYRKDEQKIFQYFVEQADDYSQKAGIN